MDKKANYLALILLEALEDENLKACKQLLIMYETNPNTIVIDRGIAPIHYACGMENTNFAEEIVKLMLNLGGDPNVRTDEKLTPLHIAAIWGRKNIVKMLLEKGGDVNAVDDENKTAILYAIYECHFDVIKIIQNYVFEKKLEKKKNSLTQSTNYLNNKKNVDENLQNNNLLTMKLIEEKKFTPNRINYNFDVTSPYYINITHRRKQDKENKQLIESKGNNSTKDNSTEILTTKNTVNCNENIDDDDGKLKSFHEHVPKNLFELTEDNLYEYAKKMSSPDKLKISFINAWREKVQKAKTRKSIINQFNDIDSLLSGILNDNDVNFTNTTLYIDGQDLNDYDDNNKNVKSFNLTQFSKLLEQIEQQNERQQIQEQHEEQEQNEESFVTAPDKLLPPNNKEESINDTNFIRSPNLSDFIMQTAEEYVHTDKENGLIFYEKRLITNLNPTIGKPGSTKNGVAILNKSHTSQSTDFTIPLDYDSEDLRKELTELGHPPGPITINTKKLYMKRLIKYKRNPEKCLQQNKNEKNDNRPNFSIELEKTVRNIDWFKRIHEYMGLELEISKEFKTINKNGKCEWREGHLKTSFVYLLIDPRISDNLCGQSVYMEKHDIWKKFLNSIFYVGKGKSIRPYQHLYDAMKIFSRYYEKETKQIIEKVTIYGGQKIPKTVPLSILTDGKSLKNVTDSKKIERILDIWKSENGVICLNIFHNIIPAEAYTREAAIIDAIGLEHLTNMKRGDYYGITNSWSMRQRKHLGIALLYKALQMYLIEGESQLLPSDLI